MATVSPRGALLRSLSALLLLLTLGFAAPWPVGVPVLAGITQSTSSLATPASGSTADTPADVSSPVTALARPPAAPAAGRTRALSTRFALGAGGSRAPPLVVS